MATPTKQPSAWVGWVYFAGIMLIVRAFFEALLGIVSLTHNTFYVVTSRNLAVFNFTAWGWGQLLLAMVMLFAGFSVLSGHIFGRVVAVIVTSLSLLTGLAFLPAYPVWALAGILIDVFVLYALVVHGHEVA